MVANFTMTSVDEITATYHVGSGRTYNTVLYQKGCKSKEPITDIDITSTPSAQLFNSTFDTLTVSHSIDKSQIASSTQIWNSTSNKLEVCQVVELKEGNMVVITNEYELAIDFNLVVDYATGDATLQQAQTESDVVNTTVDDYISAFKCDGEDFGASNTAHLENTQLNICIESESTEVVIDKIQTMVSIFYSFLFDILYCRVSLIFDRLTNYNSHLLSPTRPLPKLSMVLPTRVLTSLTTAL